MGFVGFLKALFGICATKALAENLWSIDDDVANVLRVVEPHAFPTLAAVETTIHAVAVTYVPPADVLAGTDPDDLWMTWIDGQTTDGVRSLAVEDRLPRRARVRGLPETTASDSDEPGALVVRMDGDVGNAPRHEGGPDASKFEAVEQVLVVVVLLCRRDRNGDGQQHCSNVGDQTHLGLPALGLKAPQRKLTSLSLRRPTGNGGYLQSELLA